MKNRLGFGRDSISAVRDCFKNKSRLGSPVDVFASAGEKQMDDLQGQGLIIPETRRDLAGNALVLIVPAHPKIALKSFADLARPEIEHVAIGNPKAVPEGQYAEEALRSLRLGDVLQPRFVFAENVRQVLDYATRGEVDAGIAYAFDMAGVHGHAAIAVQAPKGSHSPIRYPIAVVKQSGKQRESQRFIDLVLKRYGSRAVVKK
jgi:molybdate transport system substrate-binding protein